MTLWHFVLLFAAGLLAGMINTIAGAGSSFTLPALLFAGLPANVANATNRLGIISQGVTAVWRFRRKDVREDHLSWRVVLAGLAGSAVGATVAVYLPNRLFEPILGIFMLALIVPVAKTPHAHLLRIPVQDDAWSSLTRGTKTALLGTFFFLGIYTGFIQAGVGIMVLVALGHLARCDLLHANYIKVLFTMSLNVVAFAIFLLGGLQIAWWAGATLIVGQCLGAGVGAHLAVKKGDRLIRVFMALCLVLSAAKLFGLFG